MEREPDDVDTMVEPVVPSRHRWSGNPPRLAAFLALARANDAQLYVDDAHGFGVVGERDRSDRAPGQRDQGRGPAGHPVGQDPGVPREEVGSASS